MFNNTLFKKVTASFLTFVMLLSVSTFSTNVFAQYSKEDPTKLAVGDDFYFGINKQDTDAPILWRVMEKTGTVVTVMSEYILEEKAFDESSNAWATSSIATYLNGVFLTNSFTTAQKAVIEGVDEKILLPSLAEVDNSGTWLLDATKRIAKLKDENGSATDWWLSTPDGSTDVKMIKADGDIEKEAFATAKGVRPVLKLDLAKVAFKTDEIGGKGDLGVPQTLAPVTLNATTASLGLQIAPTLGEYKANDGGTAGTHTYQWKHSAKDDKSDSESINGATSINYTPAAADFGKYIWLETTPLGESGLKGVPAQSVVLPVYVKLTTTATGASGATATFSGGTSGGNVATGFVSGAAATTGLRVSVVKTTETDLVVWSASPDVVSFTNINAAETDFTITNPTAEITITATLTAATTQVEIDPTTHAFTAADYGYTDNTAEEFTITNKGASQLTGLTATLKNGTSSKFEISTALSHTTISTDATATVSVKPKSGLAHGTYTDALEIKHNGTVIVSATISFTVNPKDVSGSTITFSSATFPYTGEQIKPTPTVKIGGKTLLLGVHYNVAYEDNTTSSTSAKVKITGVGNYTGANEKTFEITKAEQTAPIVKYTKATSNENTIITITSPDSGAEYKKDGESYSNEKVFTVATDTNTITIYVKLLGTTTHNESPEVKTVIDFTKAVQDSPNEFELAFEENGNNDGFTATIPPVENGLYSFDGKTFTATNTLEDISAVTTVTGYVLFDATELLNTSSATLSTKTTPKLSNKATVSMTEANFEKTKTSINMKSAPTTTQEDSIIEVSFNGGDYIALDVSALPEYAELSVGTSYTISARVKADDTHTDGAATSVTIKTTTEDAIIPTPTPTPIVTPTPTPIVTPTPTPTPTPAANSNTSSRPSKGSNIVDVPARNETQSASINKQQDTKKILEDAIKNKANVTITLASYENKFSINGNELQSIANVKKDVTIEKGALKMSLTPEFVNELKTGGNANVDVTLNKQAKGVDAKTKQTLAKIDPINDRLANDNFNVEVVVNGAIIGKTENPIKLTVDVSIFNLTADEKAKFTGVYYDDNLATYKKLGGEFSADGKTFTYYSQNTGNVGVIVCAGITKIKLAVGNKAYTVNGVTTTNDVAPKIGNDGRMGMPLRAAAEALGAQVGWDDATKSAIISKDGKKMYAKVGEQLPNNMGTIELVNGRTFVPLRYISEYFNANVVWDKNTSSVNIYN